MSAVTFRNLEGMAEFLEAESLQREVWGEGDLPDPADLLMVIQAEGGLVGGAFVAGRLMGYVFGFPTRAPDIQHSHRLAVRQEARGLGLGLRLKRFQREWCLARGIGHVRWTFDPLRAVNASLNIQRLGAVASTYLEGYYGEMAGINSGLGSDRLLVDWDLASATVTALAQGATRPLQAVRPIELALPEDLGQIVLTDPKRAMDLRLGLRKHLKAAFAEGRRVVDFDRVQRLYLLSE